MVNHAEEVSTINTTRKRRTARKPPPCDLIDTLLVDEKKPENLIGKECPLKQLTVRELNNTTGSWQTAVPSTEGMGRAERCSVCLVRSCIGRTLDPAW